MKQLSDISACDITTMHCGGKIARLFEPESPEQLARLIADLDTFIVLGGGSNTIFEDTPVITPVIRLGNGFDSIHRSGTHIQAGAGLIVKKILL